MDDSKLKLSVLSNTYAVCRLEEVTIPNWVIGEEFISITQTRDEVSLICSEDRIPDRVIQCEKGWKCIKVEGILDFSLTGILASLTQPLAQSGISIFAIATYNTDYLLVREQDIEKAISSLSKVGYVFTESNF